MRYSLEKGLNVLVNSRAEASAGHKSKRLRMAATGHVEQLGGAAAIGIRTPLWKKSVFDAGRVRMMFSLSKRIDDRVREKFGEDSSHSL